MKTNTDIEKAKLFKTTADEQERKELKEFLKLEGLAYEPNLAVAVKARIELLKAKVIELEGNIKYLKCAAHEDGKELAWLREYKNSLPADWFVDSSLETWFPLTAETIRQHAAERERLERERDEARAATK